jgi:large subunit ribosomal protein L19
MGRNIGEIINKVDQGQLRKDIPNFDVGDTVKMMIKVQEADKVRLHPFEGTIIRKTGRGFKSAFTVRKVSFGEGVERIFPIHSPVIDSLKVVSKGTVRRAKLYYLRERIGKKTRIKSIQEKEAPAQAATPAAA